MTATSLLESTKTSLKRPSSDYVLTKTENMIQNTKTDVAVLNKIPLKIFNLSNTGEAMKTVYVTTISSTEDEKETHTPRKRARLDHLTMDQKLMRRKLKNRVAAQNARDRKKCLMTELEDQITLLREQNARLEEENSKLHQIVTQFLEGNNKLNIANDEPIIVKAEIVEENTITLDSTPAIQTAVETPCEPAVFTTTSLPQRWEVVQLLMAVWLRTSVYSALMMTPYLQWAVVAMLIGSKYSKTSWKKSEASTKTKQTLGVCQTLNPTLKWWGAHQRSWNPSKK